ncbi:autotransporter assembly complex family protein [Phenylobacterium deserti]|uniref:autotransporter assembly complex protein TamA n=1 Tax=Phenylobacterium deserti TaxID=1914756 RepID=UPI0030B84926
MGRLVYAVAASAAFCTPLAAAPARADEPNAQITGDLPDDLRAAIAQAIGESERPIENRFEARRRARAAAEDAIAVLRSEGYYAYVVEPEIGEGDAPPATVHVTPGARFVFADPALRWVGEPPEPQAAEAATRALGLAPGRPGRAPDVIAAEGRAVAAVQQLGYADAAAQPREVVVDHADTTVRPTFRIASGPLVRLDGIRLVTRGRTRTGWVQRLAPWRSGQTYDPDDVAELERRLLDANVYESVTVALAPVGEETPDGLRPIVVSLAERRPRTLELGGSYATAEGAGLEARWTRYNLLRRADTVSLMGRASNVDSRAEASVALPHWMRPTQTLTATAGAYRTRTDAFDETGVGIRADVQRRFGRSLFSFIGGSYLTVGASLDLSRTNELRVGTLTPLGRDIVTAAGLLDLALDRSDDPLDPRRGWRVSARAEPTLLTGEVTVPYLRLQAQGSGYLPIGARARTVLAGRLRVGSIVNGTIPQIPASRRFFAGGGGSVRGFPYQAVGPRLADNTPQGGASLLEASAEVRHDVLGPWGVAAFVDGGAIGTDQLPGFDDLSIGAGVGIRYNLSFGPIRVDFATPVKKRRREAPFQVYVSIGQSF